MLYKLGDEQQDRYGRALAYVWLSDGAFFNGMLVKKGYAVPLTIPPNDRYKHWFERFAQRAESLGRGLWAESNCAGTDDLSANRSGHTRRDGAAPPPSSDQQSTGGADRDCADFSSHGEAQTYYEDRGGPGNDPDRLDADHDGLACEALP